MQKLYKTWNGRMIQDDGSYVSKEFKSFYRQFINAVKRCFPDCEVKGSMGHYDISGFITNQFGRNVYFSYSITRGFPIDFDADHPLYLGILFRAARNEKDYGGAHSRNHFTSPLHFEEDVRKLLKNDIEFTRIAV